MGRKEKPLDPSSGSLAEFASELRALRAEAGVTYRQMAAATHYSASALARAANGTVRPSIDLVLAYAAACGSDAEQWRQRWYALVARPAARTRRSRPPPEQSRPTPEQPAGPRELPPDIADFVGRERELSGAIAALAHWRDGARLVTVTGIAGAGKTAFAIRLAHRLCTVYGDGQLYLPLQRSGGQATPIAACLGHLLRGLGAADGCLSGVDEQAALYRSRIAGRRFIVVLDDAVDERQVRALIAPPPSPTIVTSSSALAALEGAHRIMLDALTEAEAVELLARVAGVARIRRSLPAARSAARLCDRLPLALRIAGARLAVRPGWTVSDLEQRLRTCQRLAELSAGDLAVGPALERCYLRLDDPGRRLLRSLGVLPGARFSAAAANVLAGGDPAAATDVLAGREPTADQALQALVEANLVTAVAPGPYYEIRDLVRLFAAERAATEDPPARDEAWQRLASWYAATAVAAADAVVGLRRQVLARTAPAAPAAFADDRAAHRWLEAERANLVRMAQLAATRGSAPASWVIADALRGFFARTRRLADWRVTAGAGLRAAVRNRDPTAAVAMLTSLGQERSAAGDGPAATAYLRRALRVADAAGLPLARAFALAGLADATLGLGRPTIAYRCHRAAMRMWRSLGDSTGEGEALVGLARVARLTGRVATSVRLHDQALEILTGTASWARVVLLLCDRAASYRLLGRYRQAREDCAQALTLAGQLGFHYGQTKAWLGLAAAALGAGEYTQAQRHSGAALRVGRLVGGPHLRVVGLLLLARAQAGLGQPGAVRTRTTALRSARRARLSQREVWQACDGAFAGTGYRPYDGWQ